MRRTRLAVGVLSALMLVAGGGLILAGPGWLDVPGGAVARGLGIALAALGVVFAQLVRHRAEGLYATAAAVAGASSAGLLALHLAGSDRFPPGPGLIAGAGALLTALGLVLDRRPRAFGKVGRRMDSLEMR